jgi:Domain of unknown function (4846)
MTPPRAQRLAVIAAAALTCAAPIAASAAPPTYAWRSPAAAAPADTLAARIAPPPGFERVAVAPESWAAWLRGLPLKPAGAPVLLYTGAPKWRQDVHVAVIDIDVGDRDLQQCADAIMRLRGEWLFAAGRTRDIGFNYTDGKRRAFASRRNTDYAAFRKYMTLVFAYAGTYSLERELRPAPQGDMQIGDVFIKGGFPGHAVLVADMAVNNATGEKRFLLIQSYMPAQEMHVLKNMGAPDGSPWYPAAFTGPLVTPEWTFPAGSLRRWP